MTDTPTVPAPDLQAALRRLRTKARDTNEATLADLCNAALRGDPQALAVCLSYLKPLDATKRVF